MASAVKFLVIGAGSIGERHIKNLRSLVPELTLDVFEPRSERLLEICKKYDDMRSVDSNAIGSKYDCVIICTPPSSHIELARQAFLAGSNVFIEKPLSSNMKDVDSISLLANENKLIAFVGYNFRFNRGLQMIKRLVNECKYGKAVHTTSYFGQYLPDWRPWQNYKDSYTANKGMGGGIIHDGSHEVDYLSWIFGLPTYVQSHFSNTDILVADTEAMADVLLKFGDMPGYIHLDFVRREYRRAVEILCENGIIRWSLSEDSVSTFDASSKEWSIFKLSENINDMYVAEMAHIVDCVKLGKRSDIIDLENGISTLRISDAIYKSGLTGQRILL